MIVRATADNQNQLRFTAEHQPALHRDGAWAGESGPRSSVTQSRYSGSDWRLHASGAVYKVREGQENQGRKKDGMNEYAQMRHRSGTDISLRRLTGKLQSVTRLIVSAYSGHLRGKLSLCTPKRHVG